MESQLHETLGLVHVYLNSKTNKYPSLLSSGTPPMTDFPREALPLEKTQNWWPEFAPGALRKVE